MARLATDEQVSYLTALLRRLPEEESEEVLAELLDDADVEDLAELTREQASVAINELQARLR